MTDAEMAALHVAAMTLPRPWTATEFAALRAMPGLIEIARPEGFALGRLAADEAELLTIAVRPDARRRGLGAGLLAEFHAGAHRGGAVTAILEVAETNAAARALYGRAGYVRVGRRPGYYAEARPPVDAIVMSRAL